MKVLQLLLLAACLLASAHALRAPSSLEQAVQDAAEFYGISFHLAALRARAVDLQTFRGTLLLATDEVRRRALPRVREPAATPLLTPPPTPTIHTIHLTTIQAFEEFASQRGTTVQELAGCEECLAQLVDYHSLRPLITARAAGAMTNGFSVAAAVASALAGADNLVTVGGKQGCGPWERGAGGAPTGLAARQLAPPAAPPPTPLCCARRAAGATRTRPPSRFTAQPAALAPRSSRAKCAARCALRPPPLAPDRKPAEALTLLLAPGAAGTRWRQRAAADRCSTPRGAGRGGCAARHRRGALERQHELRCTPGRQHGAAG
jgi:hypothetical protein